jgi:hypothetical protein
MKAESDKAPDTIIWEQNLPFQVSTQGQGNEIGRNQSSGQL